MVSYPLRFFTTESHSKLYVFNWIFCNLLFWSYTKIKKCDELECHGFIKFKKRCFVTEIQPTLTVSIDLRLQSYIKDIRKKALTAFNFKTKVGFALLIYDVILRINRKYLFEMLKKPIRILLKIPLLYNTFANLNKLGCFM